MNRQLLHAIFFISLALPVVAVAQLGGDMDSVMADQAHMKGTLRVASGTNYEVRVIEAASGTVLKEYLNGNGLVFAVTWRGSVAPDLRQMLGPYFQRYLDTGNANGNDHKHLLVNQPDLVVHATGHMRSFVGQAYVPALVPEGVTTNEIQ